MAMSSAYAWYRPALSVAVDGGNAGDIDIRAFTGVTFIAKLTALTGGTTPTVTFVLDYKLFDGSYVQVAAGAALSVISSTPNTGISVVSLGPGLSAPAVSGVIVRPRWVVTGGPATAVADLHLMGEIDY